MRRTITNQEVDVIKKAIAQSPLSMREAASIAGLPYRTFIYRAKKFGLYTPNQNGLGTERPNHQRKKKTIPLDDILAGKHPQYHVGLLKNRLVKEGLLEYKCAECSNVGIWKGKPLTLQLNHIDGNHFNHKLDNLEFLCPNCHTQTDTWGKKNKNRVDVTDTEIEEAVQNTPTIAEAIRILGISTGVTSYKRVRDIKMKIKGLVA